MVKRNGKLQLHRETVLRLAEPLDLRRVVAGVITSCIGPDCCHQDMIGKIAR